MADGSKARRMARGMRAALVLGAWLWAWSACTQPDPEDQVAGSGTELGNVMGILVTPGRQAAAGVEVTLYPLDGDTARILKTTTNAKGAFAFDVEAGSYRLLALDGAGNGVTVDSVLPSPRDTIDLKETALAPLGGIRGYVKSGPNGAMLALLGTPFDTTYPGNAEFTWEGIPSGNYRLSAMQRGNSIEVVVAIAAGAVTVLPDTLDLTHYVLTLSSQDLPYRIGWNIDTAQDSAFFVVNGERMANETQDTNYNVLTLTETMLDSSRVNVVQLFVQVGDSASLVRAWKINWKPGPAAASWAYHAVRAVILAIVPDNRTRTPINLLGPELGTFRVLDKRLLSPEDMAYWEWPEVPGLDSSLPDEIQASISNWPATSSHSCSFGGESVGDSKVVHYFPGDTVTFFLLPDSNLGAVAFRPRLDERFQDLAQLGNFGRAEWPLGSTFDPLSKLFEMRAYLRPEGLIIEKLSLYDFRGSAWRCLSLYRRFVVDSSGRVREMLAVPAGIDSTRLLLHYRAEFTEGMDADSLPTSGRYVFIDSTGAGAAGSPDSIRRFQLDPATLAELKTLLAALPNPIPLAWEDLTSSGDRLWYDSEDMRYLVSDHRGALHVQGQDDADPAKADLFSRVELWLRDRGFL